MTLSTPGGGSRANTVEAIFARKGTGKSTLAAALVATAPRRVTIDAMREYRDGVIVRDLDTLIRYVRPLRFRSYSIILRATYDQDRDDVLEFLTAGEPDDPPLPGVLVVVDEADKLWGPSSEHAGMRRLVNYGRHFGASVLAIARRPASVNRDLTANADVIYVGATVEPRDLAYLREFIGGDLADTAEALAPFQFVRWPDGMVMDSHARPVAPPAPVPEPVPEPVSEPVPEPDPPLAPVPGAIASQGAS